MNKLTSEAEVLLDLAKKDPSHPNAGRFAQAAAIMLAQERQSEAQGQLVPICREAVGSMVKEIEKVAERQREYIDEREKREEARRDPPAPKVLTDAERRAAFERMFEQNIAWDIAQDLVREASGLERLAQLGRQPQPFGNVTEGALIRATLDEAQRKLAHEQAVALRGRAVQVLVDAGAEPRGGAILTGPSFFGS